MSFLPLNFAEQFSRHINRYFLFIACLQLVSIITPVNPLTTWLPLVVIFGISAVKEWVDDRGRAQQDKLANERIYQVIRNRHPCDIQAQEIRVGDIVRIREDEELPCDLVLLSSSAQDNTCFLQTTNLDGETNLNLRRCTRVTADISEDQIMSFTGVVECAAPDARIYEFNSRLWVSASDDERPPSSEPYSLSGEQLLQQTTTLRNTQWAYGVAVYTGNETKFGQNQGKTKVKWTKVDKFVNLLAVWLFAFQLVLVAVFGMIGNFWMNDYGDEHYYLAYYLDDAWWRWIVIPARFLLLNSTIIPISLKVSLDVCKLYYSRFIDWDMAMFDPATELGAHCNNTSIAEDLGQVEYILTDKTGTLTNNVMIFCKCCVGIEAVTFNEQDCVKGGRLSRQVRQGNAEALMFLRNCVLNNTVYPMNVDSGDPSYQSASPDEEALVRAAFDQGVKLLLRAGPNVHIEVGGAVERYVVLSELEFTSERKRMSVVLRNVNTQEVLLFSKGADDVMSQRLRRDHLEHHSHKTLHHLNEFAEEGLRTLMLAGRKLSEEQWMEFHESVKKANQEMQGREQARHSVYDSMERDLQMHGATAIEDTLQDQVPETIQVLRAAGCKLWMLTGDKFSTALQVATACNLKTSVDHEDLYSLDCDPEDHRQVLHLLTTHLNKIKQRPAKEATVILRGSVFEVCLQHFKAQFVELALLAHAVICSRVTPQHKAQLVQLVKDAGKLTLMIGDGGNDVMSIQQAHVGIGIRGKEGLQAARAADFQVNYFNALSRLMLIHGRYSYVRTCLVAQYSYYKSFFFCLMQIGFGFLSGFSGSTFFNSLCVAAYNAVLFFPILTFCLDKDLQPNVVLKNPMIYIPCAKSVYFNYSTFARWMFRALWQACVVFTVTIYVHGQALYGPGYTVDYDTIGLSAFCSFLWIQTLTMIFELKSITWVNSLVIWLFHAGTFVVLILANAVSFLESFIAYNSFFMVMRQPQFWLSNLLCVVLGMGPVVVAHYLHFNYSGSTLNFLRWQQRNDFRGEIPVNL